jgi:uncharacterized membrane protein YeiH
MGGYVDPLLEIGGVLFAALAGGLSGVRKNFDFFGVIVVGWVTGLGGGILRDVMIGATPPVGISNPIFVATAVVGGILVFFLHPSVERMRRTITVLDAWALALFVVLGAWKGMTYDVGLLAAVIAGVFTGIGGGVLRDVLVGEIPMVLVDRQFYAVPAIIGAAITAFLIEFHWFNVFTAGAVVLLIVGFRLLSLRMHWVVPSAQSTWSARWGQASRGRK